MKLPEINQKAMLDFLAELLNTPSPTGFTEKAIELTKRASDKWDSAPYSSIFYESAKFTFQSQSSSTNLPVKQTVIL